MTCITLKEFLLFFILHHVCSEVPEPVFRAMGSTVEMGYCFGVDYIVVYRSTPEGDQLLGNSSNTNLENTPADLQGRTNISEEPNLLGLQISRLTHLDTGIYRRECWRNHTLYTHHTQHLFVCDKETESEEIVFKEEDTTEIRCNSTLIGREGISLLWYFEIYPFYNQTLFLNTSVSLQPLIKDVPGVVDIKDGGSLLVLDKSVFTNSQHFHCLVTQGTKCLSFQNMYPQDNSVNKDVFVSPGERVLLDCPVNGINQYWDTPLGKMNDSHRILGEQMSIIDDDPSNFSLVITDFSDHYSGPYSCISSALEMEYILIICPKSESREKVGHLGGSVLLRCSFDENTSERVQWYRYEPSGQDELIFDTGDDPVPTPEDLSGRMKMSMGGYSLEIFDLKINDGRKYRCVVLKPDIIDDYEGTDYPDEMATDYETDADGAMYDPPKCVFKEDIVLNVSVENREGESTSVVAGVVVGLLVVAVIAAVIAAVIIMKKRKNTSTTGATPRDQQDIEMDPACTEKLNSNETAD